MPRTSSPKSRPKVKKNKGASTKALAGASAQRRLAALERRRKTLASKIARKQKAIARLEREYHDFAAMLAPRIQPLVERGQVVDAELHDMFRQILTTRKLGKRSYRSIRNLYEGLQEQGVISPRPFAPDEAGGQPDSPFEFAGEPMGPMGEDDDPGAQDEWHLPPRGAAQGSAAQRGSLRDLFLQLAGHFHPDRVADTELHHQHTEIMKELNQAYRDGDVARLLEMERELDERGTVEHRGAQSPEERCAKLEALLGLLDEQLRALDAQLWALRESPMSELLGIYRSLRKLRSPDPLDFFLHELEDQLAGVEEIAAFVRQFRDGKMTIKRFLEGPFEDTTITEEELIEIVEDGELDMLIEVLMRAQGRP